MSHVYNVYIYIYMATYVYTCLHVANCTWISKDVQGTQGFWRLVVLLQGAGEGVCIIRAKVLGNLQRGPLLIGKSCLDLTLLRPPCILAKLPHLL